jgi:hypothetical protein
MLRCAESGVVEPIRSPNKQSSPIEIYPENIIKIIPSARNVVNRATAGILRATIRPKTELWTEKRREQGRICEETRLHAGLFRCDILAERIKELARGFYLTGICIYDILLRCGAQKEKRRI